MENLQNCLGEFKRCLMTIYFQNQDLFVGTKYNYRPSTSIRVTSILSYTVL